MISYKHLLFAIFYLIPFSLWGQNTYYYRQERVVKDGADIEVAKGGQFISFFHDMCYESDDKGVSVSNGKLDLNYKESSKFRIYEGKSYFGEVVFKFNNALDRLNIICSDGRIYVYVRTSPPEGVHTCSLIKSQQSSPQGQVSGGYVEGYYPPVNGGSYNMGSNNSSTLSGNSQSSSSSTKKNQPTRHTCSRCNGKGRIAVETHPPMFGQEDIKERCSECGGYFLHSWGHTHTTCPQCHGKGYFTTD